MIPTIQNIILLHFYNVVRHVCVGQKMSNVNQTELPHITLLARFLHTPNIISATSVLLNKCTVEMLGYFCSRSLTSPT